MPVKRPKKVVARQRARRPPKKNPSPSGRADELGLATSVVRLAVGAVSLGSDELKSRLRAIPQQSGAGSTEPVVEEGERGGLTLAGLGIGIAIESAQLVGRLVSTTVGGTRRMAARMGRARSLPVVSAATGPVQHQYDRYEAALRRLSERGRSEQVKGRRMVELLIRDTTAQSVKDIAQFAVNEVTHSPEMAALVKTQSASLATDTILEVRANSEQADDRLEHRVHSWLHLRKPNGPARHGAPGGDADAGSGD
jgi:hypothetical protein